MHLIDYGHLRDGVLYHGTVSDTDGRPQSTWTFEENGKKVTRHLPLADETFDFLWNGVAALEVFRRCLVRGPEMPIDPAGHHVIGIAFEEGDQRGQYIFMVPVGESDPDFARWLETLNVPQAG
jgi:hypothetical protein